MINIVENNSYMIGIIWMIGNVIYGLINKEAKGVMVRSMIGGMYMMTEVNKEEGVIYMIGIIMSMMKRGREEVKEKRREQQQREETGRDIEIGIVITIIGSITMIKSNNMMTMYIGMELQTIPYYWLISGERRVSNIEAGMKYYGQAAISTGIVLLGVGINYGEEGISGMNKEEIGWQIFSMGMMWKLGMVPFHYWVGDVYQGSSSIIVTGLSTYTKYSTIMVVMNTIETKISPTIYYISILSVLVGGILGYKERNMKRIIGYSTVGNIGWVIIGLVTIESRLREMIKEYYIIYMIVTIIVVLGITKGGWVIDEKGSKNKWGTIGLITLMGIPPMSVFFMKLNIIFGIVQSGSSIEAGIVIMATILTMYMYFKIILEIWVKERVKPVVSSQGVVGWFMNYVGIIGMFIGVLLFNI